MIYFIRAANGLIKIGTTVRLSQRQKQLAAEHRCDLELLAVTPGSYQEEAVLHERFAAHRVSGEWFNPADDLVDFIVASGEPWDGTDEIELPSSVKIDAKVVEDCRLAASFSRMGLTEYLTERLRAVAKQDVEEGYAKWSDDRNAKLDVKRIDT